MMPSPRTPGCPHPGPSSPFSAGGRRPGPVGPPLDADVQVPKVLLEAGLVLRPRDPVRPRCRLPPQLEKGPPEQFDGHVMQEGGEPCLPIPPCGLPYAVQRLGHAYPALRLARALLARIPLGPAPSLHRLRRRSPGLVRRLPRYYGRVRLPLVVHHRLPAVAFPTRSAGTRPTDDQRISRFPCRWLPGVRGVFDHAGPDRRSPWRAGPCCLPQLFTASAPRTGNFSRLDTLPACAPVNASPPPLRR